MAGDPEKPRYGAEPAFPWLVLSNPDGEGGGYDIFSGAEHDLRALANLPNNTSLSEMLLIRVDGTFEILKRSK